MTISAIPSSSSDVWYLYLFQVESGAVKIGISAKVSARLADVQVGNHETVTCVYSMAFEKYNQAFEIEQALHRKYAANRLRGEWFSVGTQTIIADIEFAIQFAASVKCVQVMRFDYAARRMIEISPNTEARAKTWQYLDAHPDAVELPVRELAELIGAGKSTVSEVKREWKAQHGN